MTKKLRLLFIPFIVITVGLCVVYSFLNWLLIMELQLFSVQDVIMDFGIPIVLPWIPILFYFRPRLKTLDLRSERGSWRDFYMIILWLAMAAPTMITQNYLEKASGKLTELDNINQISKQEPTKFYKLKNYYIDKTNIGVHTSFNVSTTKHNEYFNMHIYIALPIFEKASDTLNQNCLAWLATEYSDQIGNSLPDTTKDALYKDFAKMSQLDFNNKDFRQFVFLQKIGNNDDSEGYTEATKKSSKYSNATVPIFLPVNEPFESRYGDTLTWIFGSFGLGIVAWLFLISIPKFDKDELQRFEFGQPSSEDGLKDFLALLKPTEGYFITPILIYINVAVFLIMFFSGLGFISFQGQDLLNWGANFRPTTTNGEWWRLLTSTFLHGGLMHLLANMYGLLFVGIFLEPLMGRTKYLIAYLLTGILASCASLWWYDATISVGASGAIFGLYGIFLALLLTKVFTPEFGKAFLLSTLVFVGFNLLMGLKGGIDNAAHIGGLASGFVLGLIFRLTLVKQTETE